MRARRRLVTRLAAVAVVAGAAVVPAAPAWAHSRLEQSSPAAGASVTAPIGEVSLTFNEHVHQQFSIVVVHGPGGVSYSDGHVQVVDAVVHQPVYPLKSGAYTVDWRVVSADTHPVQGSFSFTVALRPGQEPTAGPPTAAGSRPASTTTGSASWWPWILAVLAVITGLAIVVGVGRRRRGRS